MYVTAILFCFFSLLAHSLPLQNRRAKKSITLAILETGARPPLIASQYGTVADDIRRMLSPAFHITHTHCFPCHRGDKDVPTVNQLNEYDLVVIPGSHLSANGEAAWMRRVMEVVAAGEAVGEGKRRSWLMGICFGHHLIARAFGGTASRNTGGSWWESGAKTFNIDTSIIPTQKSNITCLTCHTQHVSKMPDFGGFKVWASNDRCPNQGMLSMERRIFTTQFHPDLSKEYFCGTARIRGADEGVVKEVKETSLDNEDIAWILRDIMST